MGYQIDFHIHRKIFAYMMTTNEIDFIIFNAQIFFVLATTILMYISNVCMLCSKSKTNRSAASVTYTRRERESE